MMRARRDAVAAAVTVAAVIALTGTSCAPPVPGPDRSGASGRAGAGLPDPGPSAGSGRSGGTGGTTKPPCPTPGPLTRSQLPAFPSADGVGRISQNPCLPLAGLTDRILGFVPRNGDPEYTKFRSGVGQFVGKLDAANDLAQCAYETDRLAVGVYQHTATPWSIGMVAVVRKDLKGIVDIGACWLPGRLPFPLRTQAVAPRGSSRPTAPTPLPRRAAATPSRSCGSAPPT